MKLRSIITKTAYYFNLSIQNISLFNFSKYITLYIRNYKNTNLFKIKKLLNF